MSKICNALCVLATALCLSGCSSSSGDPAQRAAELIRAKGLSVASFASMDSVMGYQDAFDCEMRALQTEWRADSMLRACQANGTVYANKKELLNMADAVYSLKAGVAEIVLREGLKRTPKEFVGYQVLITDSLSGDIMRVVMNKKMNDIAIDKIRVK